MMRTPQKIKMSQDEESGSRTYQYDIQGKRIQVRVSQKEYEDWRIRAAKTEQELQGLLEDIRYHHQQRQSDQAGGSGQHQQPSATATSTTASAATYTNSSAAATAAMATTDSTPARPPLPPRNESMTTPTAEAPQHSSTPTNATSWRSEVTSPVSIDQDLEEDLIKADEEKPIHKDTGAKLKTVTPNWDQENSEENSEESRENRETHVKATECQNREHEFVQRTQKYLGVPAKRFMQEYRSCKYHFEKNAHKQISKELAIKHLAVLVERYHEVDAARDYCLEALLEEDRHNPKHEEYMLLKLDMLNECNRLQDQYLERWYHQDSQTPHVPQAQKHEDKSQEKPKVPQPTGENKPPASQAQVYQPPSRQPIKLRPPPMIIEGPTGQASHTMPPEGEHCQQREPPVAQPQSTGAFQVYQDASPIPTPTGPSVVYEPTHLKFRLKDELEVIERFDGSRPREYLRFQAQWGNLDNKMRQINMSELDKYNALRNVLTGKAKMLVDTKYPDQNTYQRSMEKLETTYYKPVLHVKDVIHSLAKHNPMTDTYESLFNGYNRLKDMWDDLEHLNLSKGQLKGLLLIKANEKNLSKDTWTHWNNIQNDPRYAENSMECLDVDAFLGAIQTAMNNAQRQQSVVGRHSTTDQKSKPKSTLHGSYSLAVKPDQKQVQKQAGSGCVFCSRTTHHRYQLYCPALKTLKPEKIWEIMKTNGIQCQMCLCPGHSTRECEPTRNNVLKKCSIKDDQNGICGKFHCRFLHRSPEKEQSTDKQ